MIKFTENIIELTDYPFTYSFIGLIILIRTGNKFDITQIDIQNYLPFLVLIGVFGTILSIIDPFGNIIRFYLYRYRKDRIEIFLSNARYWILRPLRYPQYSSKNMSETTTTETTTSTTIKSSYKKYSRRLNRIRSFASKIINRIRSFASTRPFRLSDLDHNIVDDHGNEGYKEK